ncbi:4-(cytidine 5'-diphospho)-2-C-methyl-D-erythritol kinase [Rubrobacter tropicus]|uniref:4-(cytidine 5'-diphospho)-2-C-methyl-D-erythritol kinase n=1 Tax=Rubrobacter tropicus TaxID=2653851 RepID=UPI001D183325|nr:4-(cytidine 5'-diphospho)-2-C-methyl-D-erythritol kinase [Rubrobacter tropicus]
MRRKIRLKAFAKVNYALDVVGVRPDGYHELRTVLQSVSLADGVTVERIGSGFELLVEPENLGIGTLEQNTAYRARSLLGELCDTELPARVTLTKNVPAGAGLGGGSSDAAAVLLGLDELFGLGLSAEELGIVGAKIGADVPFCLAGGTALAEGVGEALTNVPAPPDHRLLIAKPSRGADTGKVYRAYDAAPVPSVDSADRVLAALRSGDLAALAGALGNDLAYFTKEELPEVAELEEKLLQAGALGASMTGSGSAVYGLFRDEEAAERARGKIEASFTGVCAPVSRGVEEI